MREPAPAQHARAARFAAPLALVLFAALGAGALLDPAAPPPAPADAPETEFSAFRALALLEEIAREPRPTGSAANRRVRGFLAERLQGLGLEVELEPWTEDGAGWAGERPLEGCNLVATLRGTGGPGGRAVLLVAHNDSRPETPGAGDDGAGVAALLEAARALRAGASGRNDLIFLFTDGEELGLLGARAFSARRASLDGIAAVLDFEARGNGGGSILFETGAGSAPLLREYAAAVPWPLASSLGPTVYERLPNDTDFSVFKRRGLPGLNFAFIAGGSAYHAPADQVGNLDLRSLQHHGDTALALARRLGQADLSGLAGARRDELSFFTLPGNVLVIYPQSVDVWVGLACAALLLGTLLHGLRTRALSAPGLALASLASPAFCALLLAALLATWWLVRQLAGFIGAALSIAGEPRGNLLSGTLEGLGLSAWAVFLLAWISRQRSGHWSETLAAGTAVLWCLLLCCALALARGASHVLAWPLLFSTLALHAALRSPSRSSGGAGAWLLPCALSLPGLLVLLPVVKLFHQVGSVAPAGGAILASTVLALAAGLVLPEVQRLARIAPWTLGLISGGLGAGSLVAAGLLGLAGR